MYRLSGWTQVNRAESTLLRWRQRCHSVYITAAPPPPAPGSPALETLPEARRVPPTQFSAMALELPPLGMLLSSLDTLGLLHG